MAVKGKPNIDAMPDGIHQVDRCLYVRKREGRRPKWLFVYTVNRKRKEVTIGDYEALGIKQAMAQVDRMRSLVLQGIDPVEKRQEVKARLAGEPKKYTFGKLFEDAMPVIAEAKRWRNPKSEAQWKATIQQYALPHMVDVPIEDITRDHVLAVLKPIWTEKPETASRLRGRLESIFAYAIVTGKMKAQNPALWRGNLSFFLPPIAKMQSGKHFEALSVETIRELFEVENWPEPSISWACIAFCALTASRVNEAARLRWEEIDWPEKTWYCPRRKDGKKFPHRVPLSAQALEILGRLPHDSEWVFPSPVTPGKHICLETPRLLIQKRCGEGTMHGIRSSFRDWAAEAGIDRVLAEKSLMHTTGTVVERAYQRSDLLEQRRPVMQAWADAILPMEWLKPEG